MGVGKTTTCQILKKQLPNSVFLDGDWCWDMNPFQITTETKAMVLENICFLLNNSLQCSAYENIIFCWVMHRQEIIEDIVSRLDLQGCHMLPISLVCQPQALTERLQKDIAKGLRTPDILERSLARIPLYGELNTISIDVSHIGPQEAAQQIQKLIP